MNRAVLKKCVLEVRLLFVAMAALLFAFCWMRVWIVSTLEMTSFASIMEKLWDKWGDFSAVPLKQLLSYTGRVALGFDEPIVVFGMSIFAISRGSDAVSGELGRGTMELLLAQPISRLQVLYSQALVTATCIALLCLATWGGMYAGIQTTSVKEAIPPPMIRVPGLGAIPLPFGTNEKIRVPMRDRVRPADMWPGAINLFALGFCLAGISTLVSACDRYRWRTIGIVAVFFVLELIFKIVGIAFKEMWPLKAFSIFTAYEPQKLVSIAANDPAHSWAIQYTAPASNVPELGPLGYYLVLLGIGLFAYLAAGIIFHRRDLPAPL
jgi:ABC-2 type transport system permease protein